MNGLSTPIYKHFPAILLAAFFFAGPVTCATYIVSQIETKEENHAHAKYQIGDKVLVGVEKKEAQVVWLWCFESGCLYDVRMTNMLLIENLKEFELQATDE